MVWDWVHIRYCAGGAVGVAPWVHIRYYLCGYEKIFSNYHKKHFSCGHLPGCDSNTHNTKAPLPNSK